MQTRLSRACAGYVSNQIKNYRRCWEQIAHGNLYMLQISSVIAVVFLICLLAYAKVGERSLLQVQLYAIGLICHLIYAILIRHYADRLRWRTRVLRYVCILFTLSLMLLVVFSTSIACRREPGMLLAPSLVVLSMLFVLPLWQTFSMVTAMTLLFMGLCLMFKQPAEARLDLTMGAITWAICLVADAIVLDMRIREYSLRYELLRLSSVDSLTGLMNKTATENAARVYLEGSANTQPSALFVIDMDQFKEINDQMGHQAGDEALEQFGNLLLHQFRAGDIVGRVGGDEFVALMKNTGDRKLIRRRAALVCEMVREHLFKHTGLSLTCSIGIAICPCHGVGYDELFAKADQQLYQIKRDGKNGYRIAP